MKMDQTCSSPKVLSPFPTKSLNIATPLSPREVAYRINGISSHNRTSMLRLQHAGFAVEIQKPTSCQVNATESDKIKTPNQIPGVPSNEPNDIGFVKENVDDIACIMSQHTPLTKPREVPRTPLQAFVASVQEDSPLTRSKKKDLQHKGELVIYREHSVEVYAMAPSGKH